MKQRRKSLGRKGPSWRLIVSLASILCLILGLTQACHSQPPSPPSASPIAAPAVQASDQPSVVSGSPVTRSPVTRSPITSPLPKLSAPQREHLVESLKALEGERYGDRDRLKTRAYLTQTLQSQGWQTQEQPFATGTNLIATWPESAAASASPKLLIGAHYDTVAGSPGVDDNGTGVAALLEIGQIYAEQAAQAPELASDLILVFFDREETGLEGSLAFATPERVAELRGAIVLEMLGFTCDEPGCQTYPEFLEQRPEGNTGNFIAVVGDAEHPELLEAFEKPALDLAEPNQAEPDRAELNRAAPNQNEPTSVPVFSLSVPLKGLLTPDVLRSDHSPFWLRGLGAVMVTDTANLRNPHYHRASDRLDTLDLEFFEQVVRQILGAIAQLQNF